MKYDYLIVGAGLFGSVFAHEAKKAGYSVIVVDQRDHIGGNAYSEKIEGIDVHRYGAHIFHTDNQAVWDYIRQFADFNDYRHRVIARYQDESYDLPFNMNTFQQMWGVETADEAKAIIAKQKMGIAQPQNLEEQCIQLVGTDIYRKLVKGYSEKQWGRDCRQLPASLIRRIPVRFEYNSDYFDDRYQGIPIGGYTQIFEKMLEGIEVRLGYDFLKHRDEIKYDRLVYTGGIDGFFDYCFGSLEYRSLRFETEVLDQKKYQDYPVVNYTGKEVDYTRVIEHRHFEAGDFRKTVITYEYPGNWQIGKEAYYPINDEKNNGLYEQYLKLSSQYPNIVFGGRLGEYRYYDMDEVIERALSYWK